MSEPAWTGGAKAVAQVDTITMSGTGDWVAGDTVTVTVNGQDLVITVGATNLTDANIATAVKDAIAATTALDGTGNTDATSNVGGQSISEFTELTATVSTNVVTVTGPSSGKPFTMTVTEVSFGDETATEATATTSTGPNHFSNNDNWSTGSKPVATDDVVFDHRALSDMLYDIDQNAITLTSLTITNGFTKKIGLRQVNADSSTNNYVEYRETYFKISATTVTIHGDGAGSSRINLNVGTAQTTTTIKANGTRDEANIPAILLVGTHISNSVSITKGDVGIAILDGETAHLSVLKVGYESNVIGDATVVLGDGVDIVNAAVTQSGGTLTIDSTTSSGTIVSTGGETVVISGAHASITLSDTAKLRYRDGGTVTTLMAYDGGTVEFKEGTGPVTVTNCTITKGGSLIDKAKRVTFTNGIDLYGRTHKDADGIIDIGSHYTLTPTTI